MMFLHEDERLFAREKSELAAALRGCWTGLVGIALFSALMNILMLTGAMFMLQVYDRVLPSRSVPTLLGLAFFALALFVLLGMFDIIRARLLIRIGSFLDSKVGSRTFRATVEVTRNSAKSGDGLQPIRDLDQIRSSITSGGPAALFDLPWLVVYLAICFAFHAWLGITVAVGAAILVLLTLLTEFAIREPVRQAASHGEARVALAASAHRNSSALLAMGMVPSLAQRWQAVTSDYLTSNRRANDVTGALAGISRTFRMVLQATVLAVGAYLVLLQEATGGVIIASSILAARALSPVELLVGHWKSLVSGRHSWKRLSRLLAHALPSNAPMPLRPPEKYLAVDELTIVPPGAGLPSVVEASFRLERGSGLGIIGPSASGKSSLARALVGVWQPKSGAVRLDGASLSQWDRSALGRHIGYLPQEIELLSGTVAENIARFESAASAEDVIDAACAAGVHDIILRLPKGYETEVGDAGSAMSAGQRQRIALARALYKKPFLLVLDEPNSNLDADGDRALTQALLKARSEGAIVVVVAHRPSALEAVDQVLLLQEGRIEAMGPKEEVLRSVLHVAPSIVRTPRSAVGG